MKKDNLDKIDEILSKERIINVDDLDKAQRLANLIKMAGMIDQDLAVKLIDLITDHYVGPEEPKTLEAAARQLLETGLSTHWPSHMPNDPDEACNVMCHAIWCIPPESSTPFEEDENFKMEFYRLHVLVSEWVKNGVDPDATN